MKRTHCWMLVGIFLIYTTANALGGHNVGSGGDRDEVLLRSVAAELAAFLARPENKIRFPEVDSTNFAKIIAEAKIQIVDYELRDYGGRIRTAINQLENKRILVNRGLFTPVRENAKIVVPLTFHEVLGLLEVEDSTYSISDRISPYAEGIYREAVANVSELYFLTGEALKTPIPLWKASVVSYDGRFLSGVVARPFVLVTDRVKMVIDQGQTLSWREVDFPDVDNVNETRLGGLYFDRNNHPQFSYYRATEQDFWKNVPIKSLSLNVNRLSVGLIEAPSLTVSGMTGAYRRLKFADDGTFVAGWCQASCGYTFAKGQIEIKQIVFEQGYYLVYLSRDQVLPVYRRANPMRIQSDSYVYINLDGEVLHGRVMGYVFIGGEKYSVPYIEIKEDGTIDARRQKIFDLPNFANVPLLASAAAAKTFCQREGFTIRYPDFDSQKIYFSGENTFYDIEKSDFVTLTSSPVEIFTKLKCFDQISIDINEVKQE